MSVWEGIIFEALTMCLLRFVAWVVGLASVWAERTSEGLSLVVAWLVTLVKNVDAVRALEDDCIRAEVRAHWSGLHR